MKKFFLYPLILISFLSTGALFQHFNYLETEQFKEWINTDKPVIIVDIQVKNEFTAHHFPNSVETNAFPVKTETQQKMLDQAVKAYEKSGYDVVVVCPRGGGGAKRCYSYLQSQGIPEKKLTILKGGVAKWPYPEMLIKG
jgi:rhodanese-related sulfurtransferase